MKAIPGKRYRHYKGYEYTVLAIARDERDLARELVIYRAEYDTPDFGSGCVWARERGNSEETLEAQEWKVDRFTQID